MTTFSVDRSPTDYHMLADQIRGANLLARRSGAYVARMALTLAGFSAGWLALFAVGNSWMALAVAPVLGFVSTQVVFFGHDAGHQQIFRSRRANRVLTGTRTSAWAASRWLPRPTSPGAAAVQAAFWPATRLGCSSL
jgi:fatty acid desaturase